MIDESLTFIERKLEAEISIDLELGSIEPLIELANIAYIDPFQSSTATTHVVSEKLIISLVNIEEEKTLKNTSRKVVVGTTTNYLEPPVFLNLYVLFSANFNNYHKSLKYIYRVISFFQKQHSFKSINEPDLAAANIESLIFDIHSLSFEQMNHLWAVLGGKYTPSILYKVRLIQVQSAKQQPVRLIEEIQMGSNVSFQTTC